MKKFEIYKHDNIEESKGKFLHIICGKESHQPIQAVKIGFSWTGFFVLLLPLCAYIYCARIRSIRGFLILLILNSAAGGIISAISQYVTSSPISLTDKEDWMLNIMIFSFALPAIMIIRLTIAYIKARLITGFFLYACSFLLLIWYPITVKIITYNSHYFNIDLMIQLIYTSCGLAIAIWFGRVANKFRANKLISLGYKNIGVINAKSKTAAIVQITEHKDAQL